MPTIVIEGKEVEVGEEWNSLTLEQKNATVDEIARSLNVQPKGVQPETTVDSSGSAFGLQTGRSLVNNALSLPAGAASLAGDFLAGTSAFIQTPRVPGANNMEALTANFREEQGKFPASALRSVPRPTISEVGGAVKALPALIPGGESFGNARARQTEQIEGDFAALEQEFPGATGAGEVAGDILTIATARLPFSKKIVEFEKNLMSKVARSFDDPTLRQEMITGVERILKSTFAKRIVRGTGRAAEAGAEAVLLDVVKGDDPFETAGLAAGAQMGGSLFFAASSLPGELLTKGSSKRVQLITSAAVLAGGIAMLDNFTDIGPDTITGQFDTAFDKIALFAAIGAGLSPYGRVRSDKLPKAADLLTSVPRGAITTAWERLANEPEKAGDVQRVLDRINAGEFSDQEAAAILKDIETGKIVDNAKSYFPSSEVSRQFR